MVDPLAWHQPSLGIARCGRGDGGLVDVGAVKFGRAVALEHRARSMRMCSANGRTLIHEIVCGVCLQRDRRVSGLSLGRACMIK